MIFIHSYIYLIIAFVLILMLCFCFIVINMVIEVNTLGNRVEDCLIASGWGGFSEIDLNKLASRKNISDKENRDIYVKKSEAEKVVYNYLKENLVLDSELKPKDDSFIKEKSVPVIIDEIKIYNPDEIPCKCSKNIDLRRTTIHLVVRVPMKLTFLGVKYFEKHVDVDTKSKFRN